MSSEKRRSSRLHLHLDGLHEHFKAQINDISVSGIQFTSGKKLKKGTLTELDVLTPKDHSTMADDIFRLQVEVIWCDKEPSGMYTVGAKIITNSDKTEKLFLAFLLDSSGKRFAELDQKLLEMETYKSLVMNASYPMLVIQDEKIAFINPACNKLIGYEDEDTIGKKFIDFFLHKDNRAFRTFITRNLSARHQQPCALTLIRKDGGHIDVEIRTEEIQYRDQPAVMHMLRDVTEVKRLEQQLIRAEKLKSLGEIVGGVAHNFNNILGIILGRSQLLQRHLDKPDLLESGLNIIEKAAKDGSELTMRLRDSIRVRKAPSRLRMLDINEVISDVLDFTKNRWKDEAQAKDIIIDVKTSFAQLPLIAGNPSELREVFINLVHNSLDAMPKGGLIHINTAVAGDVISVTFSDNGQGMSEEVKDQVFDPFFTTKTHQETGLGMSLSYNLLSQHGGKIYVESAEGEGSTFTLLLPIRSASETPETKKGNASAHDNIEAANILLVDDDEKIRDLFFDLLTLYKHDVGLASNGKEALDLFSAGSYDMVITDLEMPGMSGLELASHIKQIDPKMPVLLLTGWAPQAEEDRMKEGVVDFELLKPCDLDLLLETVTKAIELKKSNLEP